MKITVEHGGHRAVMEQEDANDICDAMDLMEKVLVKIGYSPDRVKGAFLFKAREIEKEESSP
ncbi:MAG: hypothetical protein Q8Q08_04635 [Candidatus Omnitrophota bacterium]|nr:hypothetical protein [Candidatus Omnitrophota bacterium]MDZ4241354.1 hypothetical protein [Candidatus Omnitrophota bacterium]